MLRGMKSARKWFLLCGLCGALPTAVALANGAGQGRMGLSARGGQWTAGSCGNTEFRRALGGEAFLEYVGESLRVTAGGRLIRESIASTTGDESVPPGKGEVQMATSMLAAWRHKWFEVGAGFGYLRFADVGHTVNGTLLPAGTLRAGPEWLYVSASLLDFSPERLGIGILKGGIGGEIGAVDLFGGLGVQPHTGGPTLGVMVPVGGGFRLRADGLVGGNDSGHLSFEAGLGVSYELESPGP